MTFLNAKGTVEYFDPYKCTHVSTFHLSDPKLITECTLYFYNVLFLPFIGAWGGGGGLENIVWSPFPEPKCFTDLY